MTWTPKVFCLTFGVHVNIQLPPKAKLAVIKRKLHNLNELVKEGIEDDRLFGNIEILEWVLDTNREEFDYLNDYTDENKEEDLSSSEEND